MELSCKQNEFGILELSSKGAKLMIVKVVRPELQRRSSKVLEKRSLKSLL